MKRFHQLQDEYLLLVNNDIKSVVELVDFISEKEDKIQQIEYRQKEIYRESSSRKWNIKNEEQYREYQIWHVGVQEELETVSEVEKKTATDIDDVDMEICRKEDFSVIDEQSNIEKNRQTYMLRNLVKWMMVMRNRFIQVRM